MSAPSLHAQVSSCDSAISFDGSEFNSTSNSEAMLLDHEYADPNDLKNNIKLEMERIDRKKKQNLIYEPTMTAQPPTKGLGRSKSRCNLRNWCVVFVFLISSCALALSLLVTLGIVTTKGLEGDDDDARAPQSQKLASPSEIEREKLLKELQTKVETIPNLLHELNHLKSKIANLSLKKEPQTTVGPTTAAPQVAQGRVGLSKCEYKSEGGTVSFLTDRPQKTVGSTAKVISDGKTKIIGASCSTLGGAESGLQTHVTQGKRYFWCKCAGKSVIEAFSNFDLECYLHYWACPMDD